MRARDVFEIGQRAFQTKDAKRNGLAMWPTGAGVVVGFSRESHCIRVRAEQRKTVNTYHVDYVTADINEGVNVPNEKFPATLFVTSQDHGTEDQYFDTKESADDSMAEHGDEIAIYKLVEIKTKKVTHELI